ncbi:putative Transcriptional regulator, GntR family [Vibrio nigripulchritudo SO65]|uniref:Transcriptional regulator, GntR family n=2 Tax=Vibrio nigripulchritudo TaxID=28173 RepID=A0AAV2VLJ9_9VIBR|nr:putative Transcriptional regulator, GntR family [Vibrio nigripulchritudo AM115]CCN41936.1 putative Transcriptional regulator, GntR family [Vibrio nigripulchritudo FTn2]CCN66272.1 putative Transcriptional regulator, GntR family [Vibrio nigripulchritudo POn4]CCN74629.1 putative Transcriptional regulator, GntR family [Vibrio nigripulchritudo SO65]CCO45495.1 putative Transcriptional regulator, GntR family [Vibrio nigripulchritudo SOn1]
MRTPHCSLIHIQITNLVIAIQYPAIFNIDRLKIDQVYAVYTQYSEKHQFKRENPMRNHRYDYLTASEQAYRVIRDMILEMELLPHQPLSEQMLADKLEMSRTPVREAVARLTTERLIDNASRRQLMVAPIRVALFETAYYVRRTLEADLAQLAAKNTISELDQLSLETCLNEQEIAARNNNSEMFYNSDERMHQLICECAGKPMVWGIILDSKFHMDRIRKLILKNRTTVLTELIDEHRQIVHAVLVGNAPAAKDAMLAHIAHVFPDLDVIQKQFPEYFAH